MPSARGLGRGDPLNHCALNAVLYRPKVKHWALTERTRRDLARDHRSLKIGPSRLAGMVPRFRYDIDERTSPLPFATAGPGAAGAGDCDRPRCRSGLAGGAHLAAAGAESPHRGGFRSAALALGGGGLLDHNFGVEPLERAFIRWTWSRAHVDAETLVLYEAERRDGSALRLAARLDTQGGMRPVPEPRPRPPLPLTAVAHSTCDALRRR